MLSGEPVEVHLTVENSGELAITSTLALEVRHVLGEPVTGYTETITNLPPNDLIALHYTWQTGGLPWGQYSPVAYLLYSGEASNVLAGTMEILAPERLYLPMVSR